jgi:predicted negative regulator of RcsB-dependent stress response
VDSADSGHRNDLSFGGLIEKLKANKGHALVAIGFIAVLGIVGYRYYGSTIAQAFKS